jgi:lipid A 4'-phosphatase
LFLFLSAYHVGEDDRAMSNEEIHGSDAVAVATSTSPWPAAHRYGLWAAFSGLIVASIFFALNPRFDLAVSRHFYSVGLGFPASNNTIDHLARDAFITMTDGVMISLLAIMAASPFVKRLQNLNRRMISFALFTYLMVPGMVVSMIVKPLWGRARPFSVTDFGGTLRYSAPFQLSNQCTHACSFVSGETSALFTCATLFAVLIIPALHARIRVPSMVLLAGLALSGSALRIIVGGHFLSDVVFSSLISIALTLLLYRLLSPVLEIAPVRPLAVPVRQPQVPDTYLAKISSSGL